MCAGKVQPKRLRIRIAAAGGLEMLGCRAGIVAFQCFKAQRIPGGRLFTVYRDDGFKVVPREVHLPSLSGASRIGEELIDAAGHKAS